MTTWMALFGLVWLLRVRGSLCGCAACRRARHDAQEIQCAPSPRAPSPEEQAPFDVITLEHYTRDVTVQTDFDDEDVEDLDKIEMQISEESNVGNYECGREQSTQSPVSGQQASSFQCPSDADSEAVWETADVTLERGASGLGLSIAGGETGSDVSITRLAVGGAAQKDGRLQIGDILLQVNDISVEGAPHSVAVDALQKAGSVVRLRVRRARRPRVVTLWRGVRGLGLGIAGGADDAAGGGGIFVSHIAVGGAAHHDGRLRLGDKILAVRDKDGIETSLIGATHAHAVSALRSTGDQVTLIVLSAGSVPPVAKTAPLYSTKTQATSCSTLHELLEEEPSEIPRCVRMVRLVRSGSRLGMDIVGGLGGEVEGNTDEDACGVFVSGVSVGGAAYGMLHRGDRILSVDGRDLTRATHEQAAAALKQYSGATVTIAAQYQPEQYERLRARIRAINAAAAMSPRTRHVPVHPDLHAMYPR
ncbi:disks large homolog 2 isoform X1 [Spodoptera frugiperda]|uniref:Disks large homolog 2 isoform X1 n=2 Tax=Spodoptera frugiperda TaxID=7108 RepID=A0A9R0D3K1_SPOFR|nr:disks large homolog 2 isoform X1 [Spodoptera frugiperda]XP_035438929.2 disks large homolog 2 isoform X1 [Spodoptera frugiperda]XP_050562193.1 disks large homolog 2 isoform X2 [Spodoptera frugiperda]XP_050562194.1 disks large homolog 2 isoform X1 [Spodoptera frugiperda]